MKRNETQKQCTKCKRVLNTSDFYKKGNRLDSICKSCIKEKRKTKYVSRKQIDEKHRLLSFFDLIFEQEHLVLNQLEKNIDAILSSNNYKDAA